MTVMPSRQTTFRTAEPRPRAVAPAPPHGGAISSIDPLRILRRHMLGIVGAAVLGGFIGVGAFLALDRLYPLYTSEHLFEVRPGLREASEIGSNEFTSDDMVARLAQTEAMKIKRRDVLLAAVNTPEVRRTEWMKKYIISAAGGQTFDVESAVDELDENLKTPVIRGTNFFGIRWTWHNPKDIPVVLDAIATAYLAMREDQDAEVYDRDLDAFTVSVNETQRQVQELTGQIASYVRDMGIVALDDPTKSVPAFEMEEVIKQQNAAVQELSMVNSTLRQTQEKLAGQRETSLDDIKEAEQDFIVATQINLMLEAETQYVAAVNQHPGNDQHHSVRNAKNRFDAATKVYDELLEKTINRNLQSRVKVLQDRQESLSSMIADLEAEMDALSQELMDLASSQTQYMNLETQRQNLEEARQANRELVNELQLMKTRADAQRIRTARPAEIPREKSFPQPHVVIPLSVLLLVGLTVGFIFLREVTDQRVKSASDIRVLPGARLLGTIPELSEDPTSVSAAELAVRVHPQSVLAESYRQAAAQINIAMDRAGHQTLMVCGGLPGAGSTTLITNLAAVSASAGRRVVVVDANFRRPGLAPALGGDQDGPGFGDLLVGEATKPEARQKTESGVDLISAGTPGNRIIERLSNGKLDSLIAELRAEYDLIVFDVAPAVVAGDAMVLADRVDAAVMVVRAHREQRGLIGRLIQQFSAARCDLLGIVLNRPLGTAGGYFKKNYRVMASYANTG